MHSFFIYQKTEELQNSLYCKFNNFSQTHKTLGRFCSVPVAILDVAIDALKSLSAIENAAMAAINLIGAAFSKEYTLKHALACTEFALGSAVGVSVKIVTAPFKIIYQIFAIIIKPDKVQSINWRRPTFKD